MARSSWNMEIGLVGALAVGAIVVGTGLVVAGLEWLYPHSSPADKPMNQATTRPAPRQTAGVGTARKENASAFAAKPQTPPPTPSRPTPSPQRISELLKAKAKRSFVPMPQAETVVESRPRERREEIAVVRQASALEKLKEEAKKSASFGEVQMVIAKAAMERLPKAVDEIPPEAKPENIPDPAATPEALPVKPAAPPASPPANSSSNTSTNSTDESPPKRSSNRATNAPELSEEVQPAQAVAPRPGSSANGGTNNGASEEAPENLGVPPPRPQPQFLRDQSVLLDPGEYQFEFGLSYTSNAVDSPLGLTINNNTLVTNLRRTTRTVMIPTEFRLGLGPETQAFVNLPLGYSGQSVTIGNYVDNSDTLGIGDMGFGLTQVLYGPKADRPTVMGSFSFTAPTGETSIPAAQQLPGVALGNGFWTMSSGLTAIRSLDPIAIFYGFTYTYTFSTEFGGSTLDAGNILSYRVGVGYAINSRVTLSTAFTGAYIGDLKLNDNTVGGTAREPFQLRLAATIVNPERDQKGQATKGKMTTEPFLTFGLSDTAPDVIFGIRRTY